MDHGAYIYLFYGSGCVFLQKNSAPCFMDYGVYIYKKLNAPFFMDHNMHIYTNQCTLIMDHGEYIFKTQCTLFYGLRCVYFSRDAAMYHHVTTCPYVASVS
jgi:hypothetical protein